MSGRYEPARIEPKWQKYWEEHNTYRTPGPDIGRTGCFWTRLADINGKIIDNGFSQGPQVVRILRSDAAFESSGCAVWMKAG